MAVFHKWPPIKMAANQNGRPIKMARQSPMATNQNGLHHLCIANQNGRQAKWYHETKWPRIKMAASQNFRQSKWPAIFGLQSKWPPIMAANQNGRQF